MDFDQDQAPYQQMGGWLQKMFDPNFQKLMMFLYTNRHPAQVNDSQTRTLEELMFDNPRYQGMLGAQYRQSVNLLRDLQNPLTPRSLNQLLMEQLRNTDMSNYSLKNERGL